MNNIFDLGCLGYKMFTVRLSNICIHTGVSNIYMVMTLGGVIYLYYNNPNLLVILSSLINLIVNATSNLGQVQIQMSTVANRHLHGCM